LLQVYAFLKRLGYTLVRARPIPGIERPVPERPFSLYYTLRDTISDQYLRLRDALFRLAQTLHSLVTDTLAKRVRLVATRIVGRQEGRFASLVAGRRWANYGELNLSRAGMYTTVQETHAIVG
jgi:tRNA-splicing endonuclease subunit Sen54